GKLHDPVVHIHIDAVRIDPFVLEQVLEHGVADVVIIHAADRTALIAKLVAHARPPVRRGATIPLLDPRLGRTVEILTVELAAPSRPATAARVRLLVTVEGAGLLETASRAAAVPLPALHSTGHILLAITEPAAPTLLVLFAVLPEASPAPPGVSVLAAVFVRAALRLAAWAGAAAVEPIVATAGLLPAPGLTEPSTELQAALRP